MPIALQIAAVYLLLINLTAVAVTAADKSRARRNKWRVPEATLLLLSALGGSAGMYVAMRRLHHKTRKRKFMWGIPAIFAVQAAAAIWLIVRLYSA